MKQDSSKKLLEWSEKFREQKLSGFSEKAWCRQSNISYNTFQYWKKRISSKDQSPEKEQFIEISEDRPLIEMSLQGAKLTIYKDYDRAGLTSLLSLLKSC